MSTSGSFTPPGVPECAYAPHMTRAAAIALAAGGGLLENCVVVIDDGPVIGTAGNTSPTSVELNPVSPTAFGQTARVFTTFAAEAWPGVYDIALNKITELRDDFGNTAKDLDAAAPTVHTQVPWHLGSTTFRDNYFEDAVLTGFPGTGTFTNNRVVESTLDFTGKTAGTVNQSSFLGSTVTTGAASFTASRLEMHGSSVTNSGTGPLTFTGTEMESANNALVLQAGDTQGASITGCQWLGSTNGFRINLNRTGGGAFSALSTLFQGASSDPVGDMLISGTGSASLNTCQILCRGGGGSNSMFVIDGSGVFQLTRARISDSNATTAPGGFVKDAASTGGLQITESEIIQGLVRVNSSGSVLIQSGSRLEGGFINHNGSGLLTLTGVDGHFSTYTMAVGSTRGLQVGPGPADFSTITQNGTGSANVDSLHGATGVILHRATVTLNIADAAAPAQTFQGLVIHSGGTLTVTGNPGGGGNPLNNTEISTQAVLNIQAGGSASRCRLSNEAVLNTGAFANLGSIIEGQFTKTSTAANVNSLCSKAFDDWV